MQTMTIPTHPQTSELHRARALLAARASSPALQTTWWLALPAVEALATLESVVPPYPPVEELPPTDDVPVADVLAALAAAAAVAHDPPEAARIALAAEALNTPMMAPVTP